MGITGSHSGDAPVLPGLLRQILAHEQIGGVTCDSRKCCDANADRSARTVISSRKNAKPWKAVTAGAVAGNEHYGHRNTPVVPSGEGGAQISADAASGYEEDQKTIRGIIFPRIGGPVSAEGPRSEIAARLARRQPPVRVRRFTG